MPLVASRIKTTILEMLSLKNRRINLHKVEIDSFKQEIYIIKIKGFKNIYALHKTKTKNKFNEYSNCRKLGENNIFPKIYKMNRNKNEVITEWIEGEKIASFKNDVYPKLVPQNRLNQIADVLAEFHSNISREFSPIEIDPIIIASDRNTLKTTQKNYLFNHIIKIYKKAFNHLKSGQRENDLSGINIQELESLLTFGLKYLQIKRTLIESVPFFSLLHGDMHPENILLTKNGVRLIDFENMHYGDRAWELAFFIEEGEQAGYINNKNIEHFIYRYCQSFEKFCNAKSDNNLRARIEVYQLFIIIKFLALICDGLASERKKININLYNDILSRARKLALKNEGIK